MSSLGVGIREGFLSTHSRAEGGSPQQRSWQGHARQKEQHMQRHGDEKQLEWAEIQVQIFSEGGEVGGNGGGKDRQVDKDRAQRTRAGTLPEEPRGPSQGFQCRGQG